MSSRQTSRKGRLRTILALCCVAVLLFYLVPHFAGTVASLVLAPIEKFETWLYHSGSAIPSYIVDRQALIDENEALRMQLQEEQSTDTSLALLLHENSELRSLLGSTSSSRIAAAVIGRPTVTPYDVLVLDKGTRHGVEKYAPVYVGRDQVIGFVGEVYVDSSIVVLATTPGLESTVYIFGPNIYTTAEGQGGGVLSVSVPQGILLAEGDLVIVPSFDTGVFGAISHVESEPTDPEQRGFVTLPIPLQSIRLVAVGEHPVSPVSFEEATEIVRNIRTDLMTVPVPSGVLVDVIEDVATSSATSTDSQDETTVSVPNADDSP